MLTPKAANILSGDGDVPYFTLSSDGDPVQEDIGISPLLSGLNGGDAFENRVKTFQVKLEVVHSESFKREGPIPADELGHLFQVAPRFFSQAVDGIGSLNGDMIESVPFSRLLNGTINLRYHANSNRSGVVRLRLTVTEHLPGTRSLNTLDRHSEDILLYVQDTERSLFE